MENFYEKFLRQVKEETATDSAKEGLSFAENSTESAEKKVQASGTEIWKAILTNCERVPESLRNAFVVQVLVSILQNQEISMDSVHEALRQGFDAVQRVEEAKQYREAA